MAQGSEMGVFTVVILRLCGCFPKKYGLVPEPANAKTLWLWDTIANIFKVELQIELTMIGWPLPLLNSAASIGHT